MKFKDSTPAEVTQAAQNYLAEIQHLMVLLEENPFKVRAYERAQGALSGHDDLLLRAKNGTLTELEGIGKGIAETLGLFLLNDDTSARDALAVQVSPGLLELTRVPGLGVKKAKVLIAELEIQSISELEYACRENRLVKLKGFGEKTQSKILEGIARLNARRGRLRLSDAIPVAGALIKLLRARAAEHGLQVEHAGPLRRRLEVVDGLDFLVFGGLSAAQARDALAQLDRVVRDERDEGRLPECEVRLHFSAREESAAAWIESTGTPEHWQALQQRLRAGRLPRPAAATEDGETAVYAAAGLPWIPPELRETADLDELAAALDGLLSEDALQGVFHNHTTRSDGAASLEEMVRRAQALGYKYIGISDHSQSAFYAHGLKPEDLKEQELEVRELQERMPGIRIFWGVESDILADGSLDYEPSILKRFDFVIASIHSRFKMERKEMTRRIVKAIRNPYTRFVGHLTGRLLLGRPGYDIDVEEIIDEAARHAVAIEINAHPERLDIDWRWGSKLRKAGALVSVNPDAHDVSGLMHAKSYGVTVARKALLPAAAVLNSRRVSEVEKWLQRK